MKKILYIVLALCLFTAELYSVEIKGDTTSRDGYKIIRVWGSHYERGYAYGYLLGPQINDVIQNYLIKTALKGLKTRFEIMKQLFINSFIIDEKYSQEGQGILDGMTASGEAEKLRAYLGRDIDKNDILCGNIIVEFSFLGCSSLALWGDKTVDENLIYTRNLDWDRSEVLLRNHLLTVHYNQKESDEQSWVSFGFPGLIGILSGINKSGVGAFHHMGNYGEVNTAVNKPTPIFFSIRNGIESKDYNQDSYCNTADVYQAIKDRKTAGGFIINVVNEPSTENLETDVAIVIETDNSSGTVYRTKIDNYSLTGDVIGSTNHFRKLYPMIYCTRYEAIAQKVKNRDKYDNEQAWEDLSSAAGVSYTLQTIQYLPQEGIAYWALANLQTPAFLMNKNIINLSELTDVKELNEFELKIEVYPNPATNELKFGNIPEDYVIQSVELSDIKGNNVYKSKEIFSNNEIIIKPNLSNGVYFLKISGFYKGKKTEKIEKIIFE